MMPLYYFSGGICDGQKGVCYFWRRKSWHSFLDELLARIDGRWVDNEEDLDDARRYQAVYSEICADIRNNKRFPLPILSRISAAYLRRNRYLIS